jgi:membrane glycosyltransferase
MRDLAGSLLSDGPAPIVPAPAASSEDSAALMPPSGPTSFDWTPAVILGGVLATLMLLIPVARRLQSRVGVNEEFRATELPLAPSEIRTRQDIVLAFHQLAKRCSRSVRPWWNHLQVTTELSRVIPDRRQTVSELSAVYERARYQPLDHELTPAELTAAQIAIRKCAAMPG